MSIRIYILITQLFVVALLLIMHFFSAYFSFFYLENIFFKKIVTIESTGYELVLIIPILFIVEILKHLFTFLSIQFSKKRSLWIYTMVYLLISAMFYVGSFLMAVEGSSKKIVKQEEKKNIELAQSNNSKKEALEKEYKESIAVLKGRLSLADTLRNQRFKVGYSLTDKELELIRRDEEKIEQAKLEFEAKIKELEAKEENLIKENQSFTIDSIQDIRPFSIGIEVLILIFTGLIYLLPKEIEQRFNEKLIRESGKAESKEPELAFPIVSEKTEVEPDSEKVPPLDEPILEPILVELSQNQNGNGESNHLSSDISMADEMLLIPKAESKTQKNQVQQLSKTELSYKTAPKYEGVRKALAENKSIRSIEAETGISRTTIAKIKKILEQEKENKGKRKS